MKLRLGTGLKADVELLAVTHNLVNNRAHLVNLNRKHNIVVALEVVFFRRRLKTRVNLLNSSVYDVGKTNQHRGRHVTEL